MGFVIFEQSGTFIPSNYGLVTDDLINVLAIGGGAGGSGGAYGGVDCITPVLGAAGGTSSFGSILSAPGGTAQVAGGNFPTQGALSAGMMAGMFSEPYTYNYTTSNSYTYRYSVAGQGAPGWLPDMPREYYEPIYVAVQKGGNTTISYPMAMPVGYKGWLARP